MLELAKRALLDINFLLQTGFDTNWRDCEVGGEKIDGVKQTCDELVNFIRANDPEWEFPNTGYDENELFEQGFINYPLQDEHGNEV